VILLLAALVTFAHPVVPVEATIPQVYEYAVTIDERRINPRRYRDRRAPPNTADNPRCVGHRSG
jgi:hypothetical protein